MIRFPITQKGFQQLESELKNLKYFERPNVINDIAEAREFGDLSENAEYHAAKEKQSFIESRIVDLEDKVARSEIINISKLSGDKIKFGATVQLIDDETEEEVTYHLVGEYEADITKKRISITSPLAKALINKSVGDIAEVSTPRGMRSYEIIAIAYKDLDI